MGMEDEGGSHHVAMRTMLLAAGACTTFVGMLLTVCLRFHRAPVFTVLVALQIAIFGALLSVIWRKERWQRWMGRYLATAACAGAALGIFLYYRYLVFFFHYRDLKVYTNVAASQSAALFADAGMLGFSADTHLDVWGSVGYRSAVLGKTLCVAPVVDSLTRPTDTISFFAAGVDCCAWRSRFHCGDADDPLARSALLELSPEQLVSPHMEWAIEERGLLEGLAAATRLQSAVHGTVVAENPRFLRWARDPRAARDRYLQQALSVASIWCAVFFVVSLAASWLAAVGQRRLATLLDVVRVDTALLASGAVKLRRGAGQRDAEGLDAFSGSGG